MQLDLNQLRELLADIDKTNISELTLKSDEFELTVRKDMPVSDRALPAIDSILTNRVSSSEVTTPSVAAASPDRPEVSLSTGAAPPSPNRSIDPKWVEVTSPMVGTFYRSPAPDESPFVETGDQVSANQTVCIIEAMKLMNEIEAEVSGQVMEILVENGAPVEYGQPLMRINPS